MAAKEPEPKKPEDTPEASGGPMLDMSQAAVKKMIAPPRRAATSPTTS